MNVCERECPKLVSLLLVDVANGNLEKTLAALLLYPAQLVVVANGKRRL